MLLVDKLTHNHLINLKKADRKFWSTKLITVVESSFFLKGSRLERHSDRKQACVYKKKKSTKSCVSLDVWVRQ